MSEVADPVHPESLARWGHDWSWRAPRGGEHFRTCTYCGSINPEDLAAEPQWHASWADRKYGWPHKFYVEGIANREPDLLYCIGSASGGRPADAEPLAGNGWVEWGQLKRKHRRAIKRSGFTVTKGSSYLFGTRSEHFAKFYSVHLADPALPPAVRERIERVCGLRFEFADGRVAWHYVADDDAG